MKVCGSCKKDKELSKFWKDKRASSGTQVNCIACMKKENKHWRNTVDAKLYRRKYDLRVKYNLNLDEFNALLLKQNLKCAICLDELDITNFYKTHVDHCHEANEVRGILCAGCNTSLGCFKDSIEILQRAIDYIQKVK